MARSFPIFTVGSIAAAESFYERLGFVRTFAFGDGYVSMTRGDDQLGLAAGPADHAVALWVYVDDVDAAFASMCDAGATAVEAPAGQPWGERTATVRDLDGNVVHLGVEAPA